ncbi:hypothetical protein PG996_004275 [Apiospora saccharicola]|uniref:Uncharacterized protein n=1 Tax=Apiospora saccharicola TaxID=335842 RepID=A0ABR1W3P0_9PEZI
MPGTDTEPGLAEPQPLANLYDACQQLYTKLLLALVDHNSIPSPVMISLRRSLDSLKLWALGYGVSDGCLDGSPDKSRRAKKGSLRLLLSVSQTLTKRLLPLVPWGKRTALLQETDQVISAAAALKAFMSIHSQDSDNDSSSEGSLDGEMDPAEIAEDLRTDAQCLLDRGYRFDEQNAGTSLTGTESRVGVLDTEETKSASVRRSSRLALKSAREGKKPGSMDTKAVPSASHPSSEPTFETPATESENMKGKESEKGKDAMTRSIEPKAKSKGAAPQVMSESSGGISHMVVVASAVISDVLIAPLNTPKRGRVVKLAAGNRKAGTAASVARGR